MQQFDKEQLQNYLKAIKGFSLTKKTMVCVSGGIDSMALLHAASKLLKNMVAVTVDHNMRQASAKEAKFVASFCKKHGISHFTLTNDQPIPNSNIESFLRKIRYDLLTDFAKKQRITQALLAHHLNDNVETFFMRLERGSGLKGLACMGDAVTMNGVTFFRPLLSVQKNVLQNYLEENNIKHVEDESNKDEKFTRNKLRSTLESMTGADIFAERVGQSIKALREAEQIIAAIEADAEAKYVTVTSSEITIDKKGLFSLNENISLRLLKKLIAGFGNQHKIPRFDSVKLIFDRLKNNSFKKQTLNGCVISVKKEKIIIVKEAKALKAKIK